jgi:1,4-alpha-glucan branching enzyme
MDIPLDITARAERLVSLDPGLAPYKEILARRLLGVRETEERLTRGLVSLPDFASAHEFFGLHFRNGEWVFREWAPNATKIYLVGNRTGWGEHAAFAFKPRGEGVWELRLSAGALSHGDYYRVCVHWPGGYGERVPAHARRVVQDPATDIFSAQVWRPETPYVWRHPDFRRSNAPPLIYEAHAGMAQEREGVGTWREFTENVLPRIARAGYNTIQLMAVAEHPYYASFGYQVSSFFAATSRCGPPEDHKALVDTAHGMGIAVLMDLVHSHAVVNEVEGLSLYDGTPWLYFHEGARGTHPAWGSRCFDYGKPQTLHFLLSNCRFWLDEYRFDGFRFDGVTSMLYRDHGLNRAFVSYEDYFGQNTDENALLYLSLATSLVHSLRPDALCVAEDMSGMPGLALPQEEGGIGFDFRFAMGVPDYWIKLVKDTPDEHWHIGHLWFEMTNRRQEEKTVSYAESHDQALVGDQTLIFRLAGPAMHRHMRLSDPDLSVARAIALWKMIRLVTLATAGHGYLNFMGNEFGHPEWIDFPREGNNWSFCYARRQWSLVDAPDLKYQLLANFDRDMLRMALERRVYESRNLALLHEHNTDKVLAFERAGVVFVFNFHPAASHFGYKVHAPAGEYRVILDSDARKYGGHRRLRPGQRHFTSPDHDGAPVLSLYLPCRSAQALAFAT